MRKSKNHPDNWLGPSQGISNLNSLSDAIKEFSEKRTMSQKTQCPHCHELVDPNQNAITQHMKLFHMKLIKKEEIQKPTLKAEYDDSAYDRISHGQSNLLNSATKCDYCTRSIIGGEKGMKTHLKNAHGKENFGLTSIRGKLSVIKNPISSFPATVLDSTESGKDFSERIIDFADKLAYGQPKKSKIIQETTRIANLINSTYARNLMSKKELDKLRKYLNGAAHSASNDLDLTISEQTNLINTINHLT